VTHQIHHYSKKEITMPYYSQTTKEYVQDTAKQNKDSNGNFIYLQFPNIENYIDSLTNSQFLDLLSNAVYDVDDQAIDSHMNSEHYD
jgi:hypothetical protein